MLSHTGQAGMSGIKAQVELSPHLESQPLAGICMKFVNGFCPEGNSCWQSHRIVIIEDERLHAAIESITNILDIEYRYIKRKAFDNDGPGHRSMSGPRHDNDFERIQDIRILPTTDEVRSDIHV